MIHKNGTKNFEKSFRRAGKNWRGSRGGKFLPAQTEVRRAEHGQNKVLQTNLFFFRLRRKAKR